jgi:hypothetical protein
MATTGAYSSDSDARSDSDIEEVAEAPAAAEVVAEVAVAEDEGGRRRILWSVLNGERAAAQRPRTLVSGPMAVDTARGALAPASHHRGSILRKVLPQKGLPST